MGHYWTADDDPASRRAQAEDWIDDLVEFEVGDVRNACVEWRRSEERRPTPSAIRKLAIAEQRAREVALEVAALPPRRPELRPTRPRTPRPWEPGFAARYEEPWFLELDHARHQRIMSQDQERLEMHNRILDGKATDGDYVSLCVKQATANLTAPKEDPMPTAGDYARALGVTATERPRPRYEDPEELRKGRIELGLEDA